MVLSMNGARRAVVSVHGWGYGNLSDRTRDDALDGSVIVATQD